VKAFSLTKTLIHLKRYSSTWFFFFNLLSTFKVR